MKKLLIFFWVFSVISATVFANKVILVGSGAPDPKDELIVARLKKLGLTVEPHAHDKKHPVSLDGAVLVFISESTTSANILGAYKDSTVPVVNCETWTYDDMGFAPNDTGFNSDPGDTLTIVKNHPITQGFPKKVKVYDTAVSLMTANNLGGDPIILAVRDDDNNRVAISVYEAGAKTVTGKTQALHVNIFPHSTAWGNVTADGWKLIDNSVLFALGRSLSVSPSGKLAVKWASLKNEE